MISTPEPPDPYETANAQSGMNQDTAQTQQMLNMVNQYTPSGNLEYSQTGTTGFTDSQGNWIEIPQFSATTTLSPDQQSIYDETSAASLNLAKTASQQSEFINKYLGMGMDFSGAPALRTSSGMQTKLGPGYQTGVNLQDTYAGADDFSADRLRVEDALMQRLQPQMQQDESALRTRLINQGIRPGTAAWNSEWNRHQQGVNDARLAAVGAGGDEQARMVGMSRDAAQFGNDARLAQAGFGNASIATQFGLENDAAMQDATFGNNARSQFMNEEYAARMQPLNEIGYLMGLGTAQTPQFQSTPQTGVAGVDYTGLVNQQYQSELQASQAAMGGLFGLLAAPFAAFSDIRLKTDIRQVGYTFGGTPLYQFRYKSGGPLQIGVMAHEVPEAAFEDPETGFLKVDYRKVH